MIKVITLFKVKNKVLKINNNFKKILKKINYFIIKMQVIIN